MSPAEERRMVALERRVTELERDIEALLRLVTDATSVLRTLTTRVEAL